jgi:hypothetical protein
VTVPYEGSGSDLQLNARLYELLADGTQVMVDRGVRRLNAAAGTAVIDLLGNGWRFTKGSRLRLEIAQDDDPYVKSSTTPSSLTLHGATLDLPVRRAGPDALLAAPFLASDVSIGPAVPVRVRPRSGELTGVSRVEALVRDTRSSGARALGGTSFRGRPGRTYRLRGRLLDRRRVPGDYATAVTIVPFDDRPGGALAYGDGWTRVVVRGAWRGALSRSSRRGASMSLRLRGSRIYLIGRATPGGGTALLELGSRRRTVSFASDRTRNRRVLARLDADAKRTSTLRLTVRRGRVEIDAIGVRSGA